MECDTRCNKINKNYGWKMRCEKNLKIWIGGILWRENMEKYGGDRLYTKAKVDGCK